MKYPAGPPPELPARFRGRPTFDVAKCKAFCGGCAKVCPTGALGTDPSPSLDLGKCIFCGACEKACPNGAVKFTREHSMAVRDRAGLILDGSECGTGISAAMDAKLLKVFGKSLKLRQVSAGGCGACEADTNVLNTIGWDLGRFGISFVASPRHADGLLITGPVTTNMRLALEKTYAAMPAPKIVIAVGSCAIAGGPYIGHKEQCNGADAVIPVDLYIPGCPPHPLTILDGLLRFVGAI
jgi:Ni,Fe-hydrogenase III small subunit/NAD-dependent dihydropyrimidine dehydrogenase PreA subunit